MLFTLGKMTHSLLAQIESVMRCDTMWIDELVHHTIKGLRTVHIELYIIYETYHSRD